MMPFYPQTPQPTGYVLPTAPLINQPQAPVDTECPQCRRNFDQEYRRPLIVQCGHTYCILCLTTMRNHQGTLGCFICNIIDRRNIEQLQVNGQILQIMAQIASINQQQTATQHVYPQTPGASMSQGHFSPIQPMYSQPIVYQTPQKNYDLNFITNQFDQMKVIGATQQSSPTRQYQHSQRQHTPMKNNSADRSPSTPPRSFNPQGQSVFSTPSTDPNHFPSPNMSSFNHRLSPYRSATQDDEKCLRANCFNRRGTNSIEGGLMPYCSHNCHQMDSANAYKDVGNLYRRSASNSPTRSPRSNRSPRRNMTQSQQSNSNFTKFNSNAPNGPASGNFIQRQHEYKFGESGLNKFQPQKNGFGLNQSVSNFADNSFESNAYQEGLNQSLQGERVFGSGYSGLNSSFSKPNEIGQRFPQTRLNKSKCWDSDRDLDYSNVDPLKCANPQCNNRRYLVNGNMLAVCSRACARIMKTDIGVI